MPAFICRTCGVQYGPSPRPPDRCVICEDPRQYVGWEGQRWATLDELGEEGHRSDIRSLEPGLVGIGVTPELGIGQRALLVTAPGGNVLWDVPGFLDASAVEQVGRLGGLAGISASHPHFYGVVMEWAEALDAPVLLPEADRDWVTRPDRRVRFYQDSVEVVDGVRLVQCGGHFEGSAVLHWPDGAGGRGALFTGDTITVAQDRSHVSFMWSYPNLVPLPPAAVEAVVSRVGGLGFDRLYGGWWGRVVEADARKAVRRSADRYLRALAGDLPPPRSPTL